MAALALVLGVFAAGSAALTARFLSRAQPATATAIAASEPRRARGQVWTTRFAVGLPDGSVRFAEWQGERAFTAGAVVAVQFVPGPPLRIIPDNPWSRWGWSRVFGAMGAIAIALAAAFWAVARLLS